MDNYSGENSRVMSEVGVYSKLKLIYKNLFERSDIILLIKKQYGFFVIHGIYGSERQGAAP
jgi:hypothetical protein